MKTPARFLLYAFLAFSILRSEGFGAGQEQATGLFKASDPSRLIRGAPEGWETWSPRPAIAPRFSVTRSSGRHGGAALEIQGSGNPGAYGAWQRRVDAIIGGSQYKFSAYYKSRNIAYERRCISARLEWLDASGKRVRPPEYLQDIGKEGEWTRVEYQTRAPDKATSVRVQLILAWAPQGTVWWDDVEWISGAISHDRIVRAVTLFHRPKGTHSAAESVQEFGHLVESVEYFKPDIICLPEGITVVGTGKSYVDVSEPIPGPTTGTLGTLAKRLRSYIVAGIYERVGGLVYNTAVLLDRNGNLAGKYRKTHLPYEEAEGGITPGDSYPVFTTDFGKIGILICWDIQFPESARAMAGSGAELLLVPIWGGSEALTRARAIENQTYVITSSYDMKTFILDPMGTILSEASADHPIAFAELHLDRKILQPWLGDMKTRTWKERRPDIPIR
jgi:predicted amidohydrolase